MYWYIFLVCSYPHFYHVFSDQAKCFLLQYSGYNKDSGVVTVEVFVTDAGLTKLAFPSEGKKMKKLNTAMQELISHFFALPIKGM